MKPFSTQFIKQINTLNHANPEALAHTYGVALYEPFTSRDTHDPLIVEMKPYGHYTFIDGTKVGLSYVGGSYYAYLAQDPLFKLAKKRYVHPSVRGRVSKVNAQPEIEPISRWASLAPTEAFTTPSSR